MEHAERCSAGQSLPIVAFDKLEPVYRGRYRVVAAAVLRELNLLPADESTAARG